jgi:3-hydroxybutyryl-CoA dehydrogenase
MIRVENVAVIGTGLMGKGISHVLASFGYKVYLFGRRDDVSEEILKYFNSEEKRGRIDSQKKQNILQNIKILNLSTQIENLSECNVIIETVAENMQIKKEIFTHIKPYIRDDALVASNTSSYSISKLSEFTPNPANFLGMHFFSPVPLMKLVEVVKGNSTDESVVNTACMLAKSIEKLPVTVKDSAGFVLNRGLFVMINEAVTMLDEGVADSAEDIDNIFIHGMGLKVGPLKLADMVGIDVTYTILDNLHCELKNEKYKPCALLKSKFDKGLMGKKAGAGFYRY